MLTRGHIKSYLLPDLNIAGLRRWIVYQPLALIMAILLLPSLSWMGKGGAGARLFQANALGCTTTTNSIIQNYCVNSTAYFADLTQLEQDAVNGVLAFHALPASEAHVIYDYGRLDLRDEVRAAMYVILESIVKKTAASRTTHEQSLYNWLQATIYNNETNYYTLAIGQYNSFLSDPCHFTLDSDLAKAYKLNYDGTPFCFGGSQSSIFAPPVPEASYFEAYGVKFAYTYKSQTDPTYPSMFIDSVISTGAIWGVALGGALGSSATAGLLISNSLALAAASGGLATDTGLLLSSATAASTASSAIATAGPVLIIFADILIGIVAALEVVNNQEQLDQLNGLNTLFADWTANPQPDLNALLLNDANGAYKMENSFYSATSPDVPSTATLPVHGSTDLSFTVTPISTGTPQVTVALQYQDWGSNVWSAQTSGGWFVRTCSGTSCVVPDSITGSLRYLDSSGISRTAIRTGSSFIVVKGSVASTDIACPPDPVLGVSTGNLSQCASYVSNTLMMKDSNGNPITVGLTTLAAPSFNDPGPLTYSLGTVATKTITANGNPAPQIEWISGTGGNNFNFNLVTGPSFPFTFDGSLTAPTGPFTLTLTAGNSLGSVTKSFTVTVQDVLQIVSSATLSGTAGRPFSFTVVATGNPTPALTLDPTGYNLSGLSFNDNHDGTGTLSGTYTGAASQQICFGVCGGFIATNSQGNVKQTFELDMAYSPSALLGLPTQAHLHAGVPNSVLLTSYGGQTPVSWNYQPDPNAPWLTLTDNKDGTATLSGSPPAGTSGSFSPSLNPYAVGSGLPALGPYPVTVSNAPVIVSPNVASFTVGSAGSFGIQDNAHGTFTASNPPPNGLTLFNGSTPNCPVCAASIGGTPAAGTGGQYTVMLTDTATTGSTSQDLLVNVFDVPGFSSPNLAVLFAGQSANFNVTMTGFPNVGTHQVAPNSGPPANPSDGTGPYFTVSGLPASLQANNFNDLGLRTGTLTISGTPAPADVGTYKIQITTQNGVGSPAQQTLTLQVLSYNPTTLVSLLSVWTLSRDASNNVIATVVVPNNGAQTAENVSITSAKIGSVAGVVSPTVVASIPAESSATFRIQFPAASLGTSGSPSVLSLSGSYTGGTFNNAGRIVLP